MGTAAKVPTLRAREAADAAHVPIWFAAGKGRDVATVPEPLRSTLLAQQLAAFELALKAYPNVVDRVVELDGLPVGRLIETRPADRWWILDLAIAPDWQGRGLGPRVLATVVEEARAAGVPVGLHVRRGHAAIVSYRRIGFREVGADELDVEMMANGPNET